MTSVEITQDIGFLTQANNPKERVYHVVADSAYVLPADEEEGNRLDLQHLLVKNVFGGRVIFAPIAFTDEDNVLDNGTGTGAWIMDVFQSIPPTVSFYGVDLHIRLVPADPPENTQFIACSFLDLPADWTDKFALVNQRLMLAALTRENWTKCISEIYRVLKPGAWVQLVEIDGYLFSDDHDESAEWFSSLLGALFGHKGLIQDCHKVIPSLLCEKGFENVVVEERKVRLGHKHGEDGIKMLENMVRVYQGMKAPIFEAGGCGIVNSEGDFDSHLETLAKSCNDKGSIETRWYAIHGQKPY
ncbi:S-adenosyl-L-methionine-dependent methyltransferase [Coniophora puteana RWD-64-598 SS2]|uniref:S-adenosyl-L-methionine-dependent methyltransferase n=1 Tax=Coniophora puteana (strain RWD-64-598) TaxID=741705 RepID=A0A5M3MVB6_CONPW|nr:S-adenosyl-L-methionine-dependent methyltransferase [Coniophora puteana RWD-64-598 SS2]EIW83089.1 S-adenosyl-L-methionine-dependent methyltransferase [Coniophora puteana RWD-64-598 SS2]